MLKEDKFAAVFIVREPAKRPSRILEQCDEIRITVTGKPLGYDLGEFVDGMCQALSSFYDGAIFECIHASRL